MRKGFGKIFCLLICSATIFVMCTPSQQVMKPREIKAMSIEELYDSITTNDETFGTFSGKFSASYSTSTTAHSFKGQIRLIRDSVIWISVSPGLGVELLRVLLTPDSVFFMNRIHKQYYEGTYSVIKNKLNIDFNFNAIQSVLLNDFLMYPFTVSDTLEYLNNMNISRHHKSIKLQTHKDKALKKELKRNENVALVYIEYIFDSQFKKMTSIDLREYEFDRTLKLEYSQYDSTAFHVVPDDIVFKYTDEKSFVNFDMHYSKKQFDKDVNLPFKVPDKYKPIQF